MNRKEYTRRMLSNVTSRYDKREGSVIYDALASTAVELELIEAAIEWLKKNTFADTAEREFLIERAKERGIYPYEATKAIIRAKMDPQDITIAAGTRFNLENINYRVKEKTAEGYFLLECESPGKKGNVSTGFLTPIDYVQGLKLATVEEVVIPARDDEDTEELRQRYFESFNVQAYGGNIRDYKEKVKAIAGVGGVKIHPVWNGGGTVRIVFSTLENKAPEEEFVKKVQEYIDPVPHKQKGVGIAPIGHLVTVEGVKYKDVILKAKITPKSGYEINQLKNKLDDVLKRYLEELNSEWEDTQNITTDAFGDSGLVIRLAKIESKIIDLVEVLDVEDLQINGRHENLVLASNEIANYKGGDFN